MYEFYAEGSIVESTSLKDIHLIRHHAKNKPVQYISLGLFGQNHGPGLENQICAPALH